MPFQTVSAQDAAPKRVYITGGTTEAPGGSGGTGSSGTTNTNSVVTPCGDACKLGYTPLEPIPGITPVNGTYDLTSAGGFSKLINALFKILITVGALLAVLSLTVGGVQYMTSSSVGNKTQGIDRAKASLWGILLIAGIWLILNTINPELLNFNFNPCPVGSNSANCSWSSYTTSGSSNASGASGSSNTPGTPIGPATIGTATGDQMRQANNELGLSGLSGLASDRILIYDPTNRSSSNTAAMNAYRDYCENSGVISTASFGYLHYNVQTASGGTFNAPGQSALVCVSN